MQRTVTVRMPAELHERLKGASERSGRSINQLCVESISTTIPASQEVEEGTENDDRPLAT